MVHCSMVWSGQCESGQLPAACSQCDYPALLATRNMLWCWAALDPWQSELTIWKRCRVLGQEITCLSVARGNVSREGLARQSMHAWGFRVSRGRPASGGGQGRSSRGPALQGGAALHVRPCRPQMLCQLSRASLNRPMQLCMGKLAIASTLSVRQCRR